MNILKDKKLLVRNGLKQGGALTPLLFKLALEHAIRKVQVFQVGLSPGRGMLHDSSCSIPLPGLTTNLHYLNLPNGVL
jgi:hypothetical protein